MRCRRSSTAVSSSASTLLSLPSSSVASSLPSLRCLLLSSWRRAAAAAVAPLPLVSARRSFHCTFLDPITPEIITIEAIVEEHTASEVKTSSDGQAQQPSPQSLSGTNTATSSSSHYTDVSAIDTMAKGKVTNFLRRMGVKDTTIFTVHQEELPSANGGRVVFRARAKLLLPPPHGGMYVAEGIGENAKDAEFLAAMHAQLIIDALGVPLFRLSSAQLNHADMARKAGRYAPLPEDPVKPAGTEVPGACRMMTLSTNATQGGGGAGGLGAIDERGGGTSGASLFRKYVMEAEIVDTSTNDSTDSTTSVASSTSSFPDGEVAVAASQQHDCTAGTSPTVEGLSPLPGDAPSEVNQRHPYSATCWIPWADHGHPHHLTGGAGSDGGGGAAAAATSSAPSQQQQRLGGVTPSPGTFDPTENGSFQMVNVQSTRMSPTIDALLFPAVFEKGAAYDRLKDYFFGHGLDIKKQFHYAHVAVAGYSVRMYVAECRLAVGDATEGVVIARGKAQDKECATQLAAMHAELLLDALGKRLFPTDDARQARHAEAVAGFGRWAIHPGKPDLLRPPTSAPLPLPLKQQVGGDDVWLTDSSGVRRHRTFGDRVLIAHNDLGQRINEMIEVNPPQALLTEARRLVKEWQRDVAHHDILPDAYLITKMGDFYRAGTLLPVPREYGVRGGTAIGRSVEQAMDLAALHALDSICALGLPVCADPERERVYLRLREACGLVTKAVLAQWEPQGDDAMSPPPANTNNGQAEASPPPTTPPPSLFRQRRGYLPGYIIEGSNIRMPPQFEDMWRSIGLDTNKDFQCVTSVIMEEPFASIPSLPPQPGSQQTQSPTKVSQPKGASAQQQPSSTTPSDERIIEVGNDVRNNLQFYVSRVTQRPNAPLETSVFITGYASNQSVYNIAFMCVPLPGEALATAAPRAGDAAATATAPLDSGSAGKTPPSESAESPPPFSLANERTRRRAELLAVGLSLKKKDAERMCFIHAAKLLLSRGIDIRKERELMALQRRGAGGSGAAAAPSVVSSATDAATSTPPLPPAPVVHPAYTRQVEVSSKEFQRVAQYQQQQRQQRVAMGSRKNSPF